MIDGVQIVPLKKFTDARGKVMHMLRVDAPHFLAFGEIYFSLVNPGAIKAWHFHHRMSLNYAVPSGEITFVLYDAREQSPSYGKVQVIPLGEENYNLVIVPPGIWNGFACVGDRPALVANCASIPHDPSEAERKDPFDPAIPYDWNAA